jgi:hypothetical protein
MSIPPSYEKLREVIERYCTPETETQLIEELKVLFPGKTEEQISMEINRIGREGEEKIRNKNHIFCINVVKQQFQVDEKHYPIGDEPQLDWVSSTTTPTWESAVCYALNSIYIYGATNADTVDKDSIHRLALSHRKSVEIETFEHGQECILSRIYYADNDDWKERMMVRVQLVLLPNK